MKHCIAWLLLSCLVACSSISSTLKSGELSIQHKQLFLTIPMANEQETIVKVASCDYHDAYWGIYHERHVCFQLKDDKGNVWTLIMSKDQTHPILIAKNGKTVYVIHEPPTVDV